MNLRFDKSDIPDFDRREIRRYMGDRNQNYMIDDIIEDCIAESEDVFDYRVCFEIFDISVNDSDVNLGFTNVHSDNLASNLRGCDKVVLFASTVGISIDRLIKKYSNISPVKSLCFNAIGAERIEKLCDKFNRDINEKYNFTRPRFSPGYGDLNISFQRDIFKQLLCETNIGLYISDSLQMMPSKSVTAIIGVSDESN